MKLAAGLMLVGAIWSCNVLAAVPENLAKAPQAAAPQTRMSKPLQKHNAKPADKVEQKVQEVPSGATVVTPEVTEESVQLKGVRG